MIYFLGEDEQGRMKVFETEPKLILDFRGEAAGNFVQYRQPTSGQHVEFSLSREYCAGAQIVPSKYVDQWLELKGESANGERFTAKD